jgi:hypothetical protein
MDGNKSFDSSKESVTRVSCDVVAMSTFKLQNRIEVTGRAITGMVVTDDNHLLLCDHHHVNSKFLTVYYPSGKYMKTIDVWPILRYRAFNLVDNVIVLKYVPSISKQ